MTDSQSGIDASPNGLVISICNAGADNGPESAQFQKSNPSWAAFIIMNRTQTRGRQGKAANRRRQATRLVKACMISYSNSAQQHDLSLSRAADHDVALLMVVSWTVLLLPSTSQFLAGSTQRSSGRSRLNFHTRLSDAFIARVRPHIHSHPNLPLIIIPGPLLKNKTTADAEFMVCFADSDVRISDQHIFSLIIKRLPTPHMPKFTRRHPNRGTVTVLYVSRPLRNAPTLAIAPTVFLAYIFLIPASRYNC